jgi:hypothetical protein
MGIDGGEAERGGVSREKKGLTCGVCMSLTEKERTRSSEMHMPTWNMTFQDYAKVAQVGWAGQGGGGLRSKVG